MIGGREGVVPPSFVLNRLLRKWVVLLKLLLGA